MVSREQLAITNPDVFNPAAASLSLNLTPDGLAVAYHTEGVHAGEHIETNGSGLLHRYDAERPSEVEALQGITTWEQFRVRIGTAPAGYIYRGQPCLNRLRTSFHRTKRSDLVRFFQRDVPLVHRHLTPITKHMFNLAEPQQMGAFYNLIQHHGYPTPLLDWTLSPFIAAFFAFKSKPTGGAGKVRIYTFDREQWCRDVPQYNGLTYLPPHFSVIELLGIENLRMIPQQALSTLTNVDDIEYYITGIEKLLGRKYLRAIDLDVADRHTALRELSLMGITASSLFPGVDGTCEALKGHNFGYDV